MALSVKPFLATKLKDLPKFLASNLGPTSVKNVSVPPPPASPNPHPPLPTAPHGPPPVVWPQVGRRA
jgi:hypothetical protein